MIKRFAASMLALLLVLGTSTGAWAIGITSISQGNFTTMAGSEIGIPISSPTSFTSSLNTWTADLYSKVYYSSISGLYTYAYRLTNTSGINGKSLRVVTITNPFGAQVYNQPSGTPTNQSYGYVTEASTQIPSAFAVENLNFDGYYGFEFISGGIAQLDPTESSPWMYVRFYEEPGPTMASVIDTGTDDQATVGPVPEPSSMLLLGMGLFGFAGRRIRKRFKA